MHAQTETLTRIRIARPQNESDAFRLDRNRRAQIIL